MNNAQLTQLESLINQLSDLAQELNIPVITAALVPMDSGVIRFFGSTDVHAEHQDILLKAGRTGAGLYAAAVAIEQGVQRAVDHAVRSEIEEMTR